ncbi:pilus assembly protein PilM [Alkaliphilus oremlandii]|uniref:Type IV pilus assembly protein PilM n=1 Tax=Alkaliphilus oremlandii (strain OhILAs) TaxID=350688 RepID=A8MGF3_ALKOO|nr:pilus assembly protein PilM [Alkaliphilus oremlandii]ABW19176.1 type IV pilus assembly protein PilM [Alkaliphilus oremlandii OhILAs]
MQEDRSGLSEIKIAVHSESLINLYSNLIKRDATSNQGTISLKTYNERTEEGGNKKTICKETIFKDEGDNFMKLISIPRKILSIDFGSKDIKIIEGKYSKNNIQVLNAITLPLEPHFYRDGVLFEKSMVTTLMNKALKENRFSTDSTHVIINSSQIITREIIIPKVNENEIAAIISFQIEDFLPIDPEEYEMNHLLIGNRVDDGIEKMEILLIAVPKKIVVAHLELIKDLGLSPLVLDFQSNAICKLVKMNTKINDTYETKGKTIASMDIGYNSTKLTIMKEDKIKVTRIIDVGVETILENISAVFDYSKEDIEKQIRQIEDISANIEEFTDYYRLLNIVRTTLMNLMEKCSMVFRYYTTRETGNAIDLILLQGGLANLNGISSLFSDYFNILTTNLSSLDKIKWNGNLGRFSNAIGGLIRFDEV